MDSAMWKMLGAAAAAVAGVAVFSTLPEDEGDMRPRALRGSDESEGGGTEVCGLSNLGNTCFANSVLQALASVPRVRVFLRSVEAHLSPSACVACALPILERLSDGHGGVAVPRRLVSALRREARPFALPQHHDASEFYHFLLDRVQTLTDERTVHVPSVADVLAPSARPALRGGHAESTSATNPLVGTLASSVVCDECGHRFSLRVSRFADVSVPIPTGSTAPVTLERCLAAFCESERVDGVVCERCCVKETLGEVDRVLEHALREEHTAPSDGEHIDVDALVECQDVLRGMLAGDDFDYVWPAAVRAASALPVRRRALRFAPPERLLKTRGAVHKSLTITHAPPVLAVHIRRIVTTMHGQVYKVCTHVAFPRTLDLAPYCTFGGGAQHRYTLRAVVVHHGAGVQHGHYTAFRRRPASGPDAWVHVSDEAVMPCTWDDVARAQAFMLFYTRE